MESAGKACTTMKLARGVNHYEEGVNHYEELESAGKACTTMKLASQLAPAAMPEPLAHLSMAKSSAGSSHGTGPIPMPNAITNETTATTASGEVHT